MMQEILSKTIEIIVSVPSPHIIILNFNLYIYSPRSSCKYTTYCFGYPIFIPDTIHTISPRSFINNTFLVFFYSFFLFFERKFLYSFGTCTGTSSYRSEWHQTHRDATLCQACLNHCFHSFNSAMTISGCYHSVCL